MRPVSREYAKMCVGKGWHGLVDQLFDRMEDDDVEVHQVKEKFGSMRFYVGAASEETYNFIDEKEKESMKICEKCGALGEIKPIRYWLKCICPKCEEENAKNGNNP